MRFPLRLAAAALPLALAADPARADVTLSESFGFDGVCVPGTVTPIRVELASSEKQPLTCRITVRSLRGIGGTGGEGILHEATVFLAPGAKKRLTIPVLARGWGGQEWEMEVQADRKILFRRRTDYVEARSMTFPVGGGRAGFGGPGGNLDAGMPVVGILGDPNLRTGWLGTISRDDEKRKQAVRSPWGGLRLEPPGGGEAAAVPSFVSVSPEAAPDLWLCYEGLDTLLWIDPDPNVLKDAAQLDALLEWAANGGRLVVALTPGARIDASSPLARALPALPVGHDDAPAAEVLSSLCGSAAGAPASRVPVARLEGVRGRVVKKLPDGRPLFVSAPFGLGTTAVASFDPRLLAGAGLDERAALLHLLFGTAVAAERGADRPPTSGPTLEPLVHHLRKRFLSAPPLLLLVLGLLAYVIAIGPLDYFILKKKNKLRRTVITFPVIVVSFTLLAYGASFLLFGGSAGQVRVAWIDFATAPGRDADVVRGVDVLGTYSPTGTTLTVAYPQPRSFVDAPWLGTGGTWGGAGDAGTLDGAVELGPDGRPTLAVDVPLRSHRTIQARFSGEIPSGFDADVKRKGEGRVLHVHNGLPRRLRDLVVVRAGPDGRAQFRSLGNLEVNGTVEADLGPGSWSPLSSPLVDPFNDAAGLFSRGGGPFAGGAQFAPADDTEAADTDARERMARAALGASVADLFNPGNRRSGRTLARHGIDLSGPVREGRILLAGWCDGDPLGNLPSWRNVKSTAVVVRRLIPAEGGP